MFDIVDKFRRSILLDLESATADVYMCACRDEKEGVVETRS